MRFCAKNDQPWSLVLRDQTANADRTQVMQRVRACNFSVLSVKTIHLSRRSSGAYRIKGDHDIRALKKILKMKRSGSDFDNLNISPQVLFLKEAYRMNTESIVGHQFVAESDNGNSGFL